MSVTLEKYIKETCKGFGLKDDSKAVKIPIPAGTEIPEDEEPLDDPERYQQLLGKLIWISNFRPDVTYAVALLSRHNHSPTLTCYKLLKKVFRYLLGNPSDGLIFRPRPTDILAFSDASFNRFDDSYAIGGAVIFTSRYLKTFFKSL